MRVGILTSRTAEPLVRETLRHVRDVETIVVPLPVPVISILTTRTIAAMLRTRPDLVAPLSSADMVLIPGTVSGDAGEISEVVSRPTYKGPKALGELPATLSLVARGVRLDPVKSADEVLGSLRPSLAYEEAFKIGELSVPRRGPPVLLFAEVGPEANLGEVQRVSRRLVSDGADLIVVGATPSMSPAQLAERVKLALASGRPVVAEASSTAQIEAALSAGAEGVSVTAEVALQAVDLLRGEVVIVSARDLLEAETVEREMRGSRLIIDPVLDVPPLGMTSSLVRYLEASARLTSPLLFSAADVTEDVEADTAGVHGLLALMAVEVRASAYLVVEETYKSYRGTAEAREAIRLAEQAWTARTTERGMFSRLLILKQASPPPAIMVNASPVERVGYVEPRLATDHYVVVSADHATGEIVVTLVRDGKAVASVAGRHAMSVARAAVRRFGLDPEHSAYLGYEVAKAELAIKLGRTYTQDEQVIVTPWERNGGGTNAK